MEEAYARRRAALAEALGEGCLILRAPSEKVRSRDTHYPWRQSSDLLWLAGFPEPGTVAVFRPTHSEHPFVLFVRPRDPEREIWDGRRAGPEGAVRDWGADAAWSIEELDERLPELVRGADTLFHVLGDDAAFDAKLIAMLRRLGGDRKRPDQAPRRIEDPRPLLHRGRLVKEECELASLRLAAEVSAHAHLRAMQETQPGWPEYRLQALLEHDFVAAGGSGPAYTSIVAGGANACILHYVENREVLREGELVLVDAGAEVQHYAGDITRTWPVGATFTAPQRDLYQAVLDAQKRAVDRVRVGTSNHDLHQATIRDLCDAMRQLGLTSESVDSLVETEGYKRWFMHGTGHYLGLDVHDVGPYYVEEGVGVPYAPGMVVTIEPGLYVGADDTEAPEAFRGIGVRIEDDVVVTAGDPEVLTTAVPKEVAELEAIRGAAIAGG